MRFFVNYFRQDELILDEKETWQNSEDEVESMIIEIKNDQCNKSVITVSSESAESDGEESVAGETMGNVEKWIKKGKVRW